MTVYSLYIFDRHCACIYYQDWYRTQRPKPAAQGTILDGVARVISPQQTSSTQSVPEYSSPRNTLMVQSGVVVAVGDSSSAHLQSPQVTSATTPASAKGPTVPMSKLPFDEESKLVYGVIFSLKAMVQKLSGRDEAFVSYRTSSYRLHVFETPTGYKFVLLTDPGTDSMRSVLRQIYTGPFLEYVVRNPLIAMDSREKGVDNEHFRLATDRLIRSLSVFAKNG